MYELLNSEVYAKVVYTNSTGKKIEFIIEKIINRKLREPIRPKEVFYLVNKFIEFKGVEFKDKLYEYLVDAKNTLMLQASRQELDPKPFNIIHNILDMFDYDEVSKFLRDHNLIKDIKVLPEVFDNDILVDGRGTREQTYVKDDYRDLISLITVLKSTTCVIGAYATFKSSILERTIYKEYILFDFYVTHKIIDTKPFKKIYDFIGMLVKRMEKDVESTAIKVIEKNQTVDRMQSQVTALVVMQKLLLNNEMHDDDIRYTVTKIYSYASDQLTVKEVNNKIRIKYFKSGDTDTNDAESVFESGRSNTIITTGSIEEFKSVSNDVNMLARHIGLDLSKSKINELIKMFKPFVNNNDYLIIKENIIITSWIFKDVLDPLAFEYLEIDRIIIHLALAYEWLLVNDFPDLALLLSSTVIHTDDFKLNFSPRNKLDPDLKEELDKMFPHKREAIVNGVPKELCYVDLSVSKISKEIKGYNLFSILDSDRLLKDFDIDSREVYVDENIKNLLVRLILKINGLVLEK